MNTPPRLELDPNECQAVAAELRKIAQRMSDARGNAATDASALKLLLRSHGEDATQAIKPVWPVLKSSLPWVRDGWLMVALPSLRHCLDGAVDPEDGDAFVSKWTAMYREPVDGEINCDWESWELTEDRMEPSDRLKFYLKQSRRWSDLLIRFANLLETQNQNAVDDENENIVDVVLRKFLEIWNSHNGKGYRTIGNAMADLPDDLWEAFKLASKGVGAPISSAKEVYFARKAERWTTKGVPRNLK